MKFTDRELIVRTCTDVYKDYRQYRDKLKEDFHFRCAYCDTREDIITTPFEIDHFIPRKVLLGKREDLICDYSNLVYSCKKCNDAKGSKFEGDIFSEHPTNELFYDPVKTNYNDIFYRNDFGFIVSDDIKGKKIIELMRLYRPIYALAWVVGQANQTVDALDVRIEHSNNIEEKRTLEEARTKLFEYTYRMQRNFTANYNAKNDYNK